jgi:ferredoxin--NADP+ reductase
MSCGVGASQRPLRVAIVGAGPSGFYAADALLRSEKVRVDMFDRLPVPYGLVRYGVAPDHAKIKNVTKVYEKIAEKGNFSFLGNVTVGRDISVAELRRFYDAILFACGAETDRKLGIPGEDMPGSHTATEFVAWYNGHPDYRERQFNLSQKAAVVIGQGNVAVDVCRILCKTADELKHTDIARHALDALAQSKIEEVHMVGRRGPVQAAFTPAEIREFGELADCTPVVDPADLEINEASREEMDDPHKPGARKNFETLRQFACLPTIDRQAAMGQSKKKKKFFIHFCKSPVALAGRDNVEEVILEKNQLAGEPGRQKARGTGEKETIPCGLFFRSVGYRGIPVEGVPFDEQGGIIPNKEGRVIDNKGDVFPGLYAAGWIKRGPSGVIGTNKPDSEETVRHILEDAGELAPCGRPDTEALIGILGVKKIKVVRFPDWKKIDAEEIRRGLAAGKPREKIVSTTEMLSLC